MTTHAPPGQGTMPPAAPQKKRHRLLKTIIGGVGAIALIIIIAAVAGGGGGSSSPTANAPTSKASTGANAKASTGASAQAAGIGTPVRDGKFEFVVTSVTYAKNVGGQFGKTAQGKFALLHLKVTNIGDQSQALSDSAQYVYDSSGRKYSADSEAGIYANSTTNSVFFNDINPGNTVRGVIAFDMPKGITPVRAELHDSIFSGGVSVTLR